MEKIELINLTLDQIRWAAQTIEDVRMHAEFHSYVNKDDTVSQQMQKDCNKVLDDCRIALRDVLEIITEYQNMNDVLSGVDVALTEVPLDLIYERTTEEDYE